MRLTRLRLNQICQFEKLDWELGNGLLGVYGPNGAGKSNSMNLAPYAGLTGDYSRHVQGKEGMIRQQADPAQNSSICLNFTHDGGEYELIRSLRAPVKNRLRLPDGRELTKTTEIQPHLEEVLGIRRQLIDHFMFVTQGNLFSFLSAVAAERAKSFAYLCDTVKAEKIWDLLGQQITLDTPLATAVVDNRDEIRQRIGGYKERLRIAADEEQAARAGLLRKSQKEAADLVLENWNSFRATQTNLETARSNAATLRQAAIAAKKLLTPHEEAVAALERESVGDPERLQAIAGELATINQQQSRWDELVRVEQELARFPQEPVPPVNLDPDIDIGLVQERIETLVSDIRQYKATLGRIDDVAVCPTCGQPTDSLQAELNQMREALPGLEKQLLLRRSEAATYTNHQNAVAQWQRAHTTWTERKAALDRRREAVVDATQPKGMSELSREKSLLQSRVSDLLRARTALTTARNKFESAKGSHQEAERWVTFHTEELQKFDVTEADAASARAQLDRHAAANLALSAAQAKQTELQGFVTELEQELERIGTLLLRSAKARRMIAAFNDVRDFVMHRDKLPHIVHCSYLKKMESEINATLELFESPFHVTTTDDISFTAHFHNGTVMPAGGLSGGQKVMLAMAFRMTVNSLFAPQVGMMVLDEPTDGLDADNRKLAANMFRRLGELARSRGHQVVIVTHDDALQTAFDQVFVLERAV